MHKIQYPELAKPKYIFVKHKNDKKQKKYSLNKLSKILGPDFIEWKETIIIDSTYMKLIPSISNKEANQKLKSFYDKMKKEENVYFYLDESDIGFSTYTNRKFNSNEEIYILYSGELKPEKKLNKKEYKYALTIPVNKIDKNKLYNQVITKLLENNKNPSKMTIKELGKFALQMHYKNQVICSGLEYRNFGVYAPHLPPKESLTKEEYFCHEWLQENVVTANLEAVFLPHYNRIVPVLKKIKGIKIEKDAPLGHDYGLQVSELPVFVYHGRFFIKENSGYTLIYQQPFRKTVDYYFSDEEIKKHKQKYNPIWTKMKGKSKLEVIKAILNSKDSSGIDITQLLKLLAFTHKKALQSLTNKMKIKIFQYANYYHKQFFAILHDKNMKEFLHKNQVPTIYTELLYIPHQITNSINTIFNQKLSLINQIFAKLTNITSNYKNKWKVSKTKNKKIIKFNAKLSNKKYEEIKSLLITKGFPKNSIDKKALKKYPGFYILYIDPEKTQSLLNKEIAKSKHTFSW